MTHITPICRSVHRVMVIGLDGATYDVLTPLAELGVMPNLSRLMENSALAELRSTLPSVTPTAWTSFLTGNDPTEHGIWDYRHVDHVRGRIHLNQSGRIPGETLFDIVSRDEGEVVSINLPMTYPPRKGIRGLVIGGIDSPSSKATLAPYRAFAKMLRSARTTLDLKSIWKDIPADYAGLCAAAEETERDFQSRSTAAYLADAFTDWRLMVVQFQTLDSLQHRCWHLLGLDGNRPPHEDWKNRIHAVFRELDRRIGDLCEMAHRRGAAVMVVSDHGFGPYKSKINMPELLEDLGFQQRAPWHHKASFVLRRWGWKAGRYVRRRMSPVRGASISCSLSSLAPIHWKKSRAVSLHGDLGAMLYVNSADRFRGGPIRSATDRERTIQELSAALLEARDPNSGEALFQEVLDLTQQGRVDTAQKMWPDLAAIPSPGYHTGHKFNQPGTILSECGGLSGTHRRTGVLIIHSMGAVLGRRYEADLRDIAPTILALLGMKPGPDMTGRPLEELFSHSIAPRTHSIAPQTTTPATFAATLNGHQAPLPYSDSEKNQVEDRLRDLGYLD